MRCASAIWLAAACITLSGCSKLVKVSGVVTLDGEPLDGGAITFMPETKGISPAAGPVLAGGRFRMVTRNNEGIMPGKYKVVISSKRNGKEIIPSRYSNPRETILTFEGPTESQAEVQFALTTAE